MGSDEWPTARPLIDLLEFDPYRFEFDQAIRLIEMLIEPALSVGEGPELAREAVRLRSEMDFAFPASVVRELRFIRNRYGVLKKGDMTAALFGVAGVLGPLPLAFTDLLMDRRARRDTAMRDFLDIFNHRLLSIYHRVRAASRIRVQWRHPLDHPVARYLLCVAGLGTDGLRDRLGKIRGGRLAGSGRWIGGSGRRWPGSGSRILGLGPGEAGSGGAGDGQSDSDWGFGGADSGLGGGAGDSGWDGTPGFGVGDSGAGGPDWDSDAFGSPGFKSRSSGWKSGPGFGDGGFPSDWEGGPDGPGWESNWEGVPDACLLFYSLHFGSRPGSTSGLECMLTDFFGVETSVKAFKGKWFDLDRAERTAIGVAGRGTNQVLGHTASLGSRAYDAGGGFDLEVKPKTQEMVDDFLPGGRAHTALARMTRMYVGAGPEFGIQIRATLPGRKVPGLSVSNKLRLGWTARVCDSADLTLDPNAVTETVIQVQAVTE